MILYPGVFLSILIFILYRKSRFLCSFGKKIVTLQPKSSFSFNYDWKEKKMACLVRTTAHRDGQADN